MKKKILLICTMAILLPLTCFAGWPEYPLKPAHEIPTPVKGKEYCPQTIQCNYDYTGDTVPCQNTQQIGPWQNSNIGGQRYANIGFLKPLSGIITMTFSGLQISFFNASALNPSHHVNCLYDNFVNKSTQDIHGSAVLHPKKDLYFLPDPSSHHYHKNVGYVECHSLNAQNCPLLMYNNL